MFNIFNYLNIKSKKEDAPLFIDYDETKPNFYWQELEGIHTKRFVRFDSKYFKELINEMRNNPQCSYVTYLGDNIKDDETTPKYLSVMLKNMDCDETGINNDILASRICNQMQVPTVYNKRFDNDEHQYLLSVDFLKFGERIEDMNWLLNEVKGDGLPLNYNDFGIVPDIDLAEQMMLLFDVELMYKSRDKGNDIKFDKEKYYNDFVMLSLTEKFILGNLDFWDRNFCNIIDSDGNRKLGPMFDCESAFVHNHNSKYGKEDIMFALNRHPKVIEKFKSQYANLIEPKNLSKVFEEIKDKKYVKETKEIMINNYQNFLKAYNYANMEIEIQKGF